jgi:hypothetical protein
MNEIDGNSLPKKQIVSYFSVMVLLSISIRRNDNSRFRRNPFHRMAALVQIESENPIITMKNEIVGNSLPKKQIVS